MAESSIAVAVRIRPFSAREATQLAPQDNYQPFLGDGGLSAGSPAKVTSTTAGASNAPSLRTKFLRPIISPVDDKVLIFDPPDTNPLTRLYNAGQNTFGHGNKKAKDVRYAFDRVFDDKCGQDMVFENTTRPLLDGILNGYNASVFAYGATGCGKTHTISGTADDPGVIFLTMKELYERIETSREECDVHVRLSYLEIYNESIRDLLSPLPTPPGQGLMLREDAAKKMSVVGITEHVPQSPEQVLEMIQEGNLRRTMSATEANAVSSRSHAVLQINVTQRPRTADTITETTSASLNIIDLAGSERAAATRNNGARMKEGANINKSLLALGNCINALCQSGGQRSRHVPYRNSKLTRLLKFSLGGNCKTVMIVCVSPSSAHYDETHNTLKYANQAKNIRTKVSRNMLNVDRHVAQYVQAIHELKEEVVELKAKLAERGAWESAAEKKKKVEMAREVEEAKTKMREGTGNVKRIVQDKASAEARLVGAGARLCSLRERLSQLQAELQETAPERAKDLECQLELLSRMASTEEATLRDEQLLSTVRSLSNSLQMQRGIIVAACQNTKFDEEAAETVRTFGDCMLAEVEALRSNVKFESLKAAFDLYAGPFAELVTVSTRSTFALREAALQVGNSSQQGSDHSDLSLQLQKMSDANDDFFARLAGFSPSPLRLGQSNALQRNSQAPQTSVQQHTTARPLAKAAVPVKSRRPSVGPRRSGVHASRGSVRTFSNGSAASAPKKSFRWADEAGEGAIDDHSKRRSASPSQERVSLVEKRAEVGGEEARFKTRMAMVRGADRDLETGHSSGAEWEDVGRESGGRMKREGMFERNFLTKKGARVEKTEEVERESSVLGDDQARAPLSELSNGVSDTSCSSDDYLTAGMADYAPKSVRSSPYRRRSSQSGPVRRKARSSLGDASSQSIKAEGAGSNASRPPRLASGPPLFTASRGARASQINGSTNLATTTKPPAATLNTPTGGRATPPSSVVHRSSSGTAWR